MKKVIFIKLGGSIITDKNTPKKANLKIIRQLAEEIKSAQRKIQDLIIIGHGSGSFGHQSASKYKTIDGIKTANDLIGMVIVKQDANELNQIITTELIGAGLKVFTLPPSSFITSRNKKTDKVFLSPLLEALKNSLIPVVYGDVILDSKIGCTIYSTEEVFTKIVQNFPDSKFLPKLIIQVGKTEGVYATNGKTISIINRSNFKEILDQISGSESRDVTGGMMHKINEAFSIAKKGIPTLLISGNKGNLEKAMLGTEVTGTLVNF